MCSQFIQILSKDTIKIPWLIPEEFYLKNAEPNESIIYPHQNANIITKEGILEMKFSLIPSWSKERKPKFETYNSRIETVLEKPTWKDPFINHHCLVPIRHLLSLSMKGS